jgi:hypothetical protein
MPSRMTPANANELPEAAFLGSSSLIPTRVDPMADMMAVQGIMRTQTSRFISPGPNQLQQ